MGPRSSHTAQEGDAFRLLEMTVLRCEVQINPRTTAKDLVKMLEETGTKVSISTVKLVLYRHNLKGHSARKTPLLWSLRGQASIHPHPLSLMDTHVAYSYTYYLFIMPWYYMFFLHRATLIIWQALPC